VEIYCRVRQATRNVIVRRMRVVCWVTKAKDTHSEYVILIVLPLQQWLHESPSALRYTYTTLLVLFKFFEWFLNKGRWVL